EPSALIKALSTDPEYLKNKASDSNQVVDYKDWQIALSRRFRAMKLWLVLRSYGVSNLRNFIRGEEDANEFNRKLLESINATGRVYMTHAVVWGVYVIRLAVGATLTDYCHVNKASKEIQEHAHTMQS
ncbi:unnamed protein product, partial [Ilex paraguariensis]